MPKVGSKHYSYSKRGVAAAKKEAKRTGKPLKKAKKSTVKSRTKSY
jgi:hypothetical protein